MSYTAGFNIPGYLPDGTASEFQTFEEAVDSTVPALHDHGVKNADTHAKLIREVWVEEKLTPRYFEFSIILADDLDVAWAFWVQKRFEDGGKR